MRYNFDTGHFLSIFMLTKHLSLTIYILTKKVRLPKAVAGENFPMSVQTFPGLYIHVPFCRTKCPYCDFYSSTDVQLVNDFIIALEKELLYYCKSFPAVDTVYLGGGTPTVLPDGELAAIMAMVHRRIAVAPDAEITIEANPNDLNLERLSKLRSLGFNRISLGVQSFDDEVLQLLGRRHTADEARQAIKQARQAGFDNISIDLMYGLPGQSLDGWLATLEEAFGLAPEHLSCYQLTIKEETPFFERARRGEFKLCSEADEERLFMETAAFLEDRGYCHYEVSNFSRAENLQARHNSKYWSHVPYLGLGPAAHSFDGRQRWWNQKSVEGYVQKLLQGMSPAENQSSVIPACPESLSCGGKDSGQAGMTGKGEIQKIQNDDFLPCEGCEKLTDDQLRSEALMLALRTCRGIALDVVGENPAIVRTLERLEADGLVTFSDNRVAPTRRGLLLADHVARELYGNML
jgi:oxygen-independent coproporphyrinogen-3 oxidase